MKKRIVLFDVKMRDTEDTWGDQMRDSHVGWIEGGWDNKLENSKADQMSYFFFDTLEEIEALTFPYELDSDTVIESIDLENPITFFYDI